MHGLTILLLGLASNLDNLGIGVAYGIRSTKIPFRSNFIIALISMAASYLSLTAGQMIARFVSVFSANLAGGLMIMIIGVWVSTSSLQRKARHQQSAKSSSNILTNPANADVDRDLIISAKESVALGMALAINCLATGLGAGMSGVSPIAATISIGVCSLLSVDIGVRAGRRLSSTWLGRSSNVIAGLLLVLIGLYEIVV